MIILGLCHSTDDLPSPERLSLPPSETKENELIRSSSADDLVKGDSLQPVPVVFDEFVLESDAPDGGTIQSLSKRRPSLVLVAALNGTVQLVESKSHIPLWSFSSGTDTYSSYQAPTDQGEESGSRFENTSLMLMKIGNYLCISG